MNMDGLEGVVVAETRLSDVDGEHGRLVIRGHDVEELAERADFEAACALLWDGALPDAAAHERLRAQLGRARVAAFAKLARLGDALGAEDGMGALRAALSHLRAHGHDFAELHLELTAAVAVFAAAWARRRRGAAPVAPDPSLGHAADYLRMASAAGSPTSDRGPMSRGGARSRALDAYLVTASDHGMNASTFTARVVASTDSDAVSAVVAALCALKGPRHGGAPGPVLAMLDAIGEPGNAAAWIERELA